MFLDLILGSAIPVWYGLLTLVLVLLSIAFHEFAHAYTADRLGDPTPRMNGRVTLNPLAHLDPIGTIMMLIGVFGWGKATPVNPFAFKKLRRDFAITAIVGPLSNILFAGFLVLTLKIASIYLSGPGLYYLQYALVQAILIIGVNLVVFNLIPISPLDGERVLMFLLPPAIRSKVEPVMSRFGLFLIILLILPILPGGYSVLSYVILPVQNLVLNFISPLL